jgi:uncharacterized membrane protein YheB (UPF0754 family)
MKDNAIIFYTVVALVLLIVDFLTIRMLFMDTPSIILIPTIAALIGWITNFIAIRMLFRPRTPINLGVCTLHGLVPKRQAEIARSIGDVVARDLISHDDITSVLKLPETKGKISSEIEQEIDGFIRGFAEQNPMVGMFLQGEALLKVRSALINQLEERTPRLIEHVITAVEDKVDFQKIVETKVATLELDRLEELINRVASRELRAIELLGGVLGFLVGILQLLIIGI